MKKIASVLLCFVLLMSLVTACAPKAEKSDLKESEKKTAVSDQGQTDDKTSKKTDLTEAEKATTPESTTEVKETAEDKQQADAQTAPTQLDKITVMLDWQPNTNHTGLFVAQDKGFFEALGLEVEFQQAPEDSAAPLVASGEAQLGVDFQDFLGSAWAKSDPLPVTAVAAIIQHNTSGIISLKDKGIASFGDLTGHTYATWSMPIELALMEKLVNDDGGDWSKVEQLPSTVTDVVAGLKTDADAIWIYYGWDGIATELKGLDTNFLQFSKANPIFDYYTPVLIANNDFLTKHADIAKKAMAAISQGYTYAAEHPREAAEILLNHAPELDKEMVEASQKYLSQEYISDAEQWGVIDAKRWDDFFAWLWSEKLIDQEIPAGFGFSNEYLPEK